jgi:Peptidase A4 family
MGNDMKRRHLISALAIVGSVAGAGVAASSAVAATTDQQSAVSANWSGYVVGGSSSDSNQQFTSVSGSWTEPSTNCSSGQGDAAFWVGLGGAGQGSQHLEQVGTESDCNGTGSASHYSWWEIVPQAPVRMDVAIHPGDHISAKVTVSGSNVTMSLTDDTTGQSASKTQQMSDPDLSSAEWIAEAPSQCDGSGNCTPVQLADFGTVGFTNATATSNGHTGTISDSNWASEPVQLSSSSDGFVSYEQTGGAAPSNLSSDGSSFSVAYQADGGQSTATSGAGGGYPGGGAGGYGDSGYGGSGYGGGGYGYGGGGYGYGGGGYGYGGYGGYAGGYTIVIG